MNDRLRIGPDGVVRCWWPGDDPLYVAYHDDEWGYPVTDDRALFQKISLDAFQAGLAWITILRKREAFREAFDGFDIETVASYDSGDVEALLANPGIIRHRGKIEATITNARLALGMIDEFGSLATYLWRFAPTPGQAPTYDIPAVTEESKTLSADLRSRGWKFVGPTVIYAFMQAIGMTNDHLDGCSIRSAVEAAKLR
ncbi:DNA-3-methyladenine glycosylase 1 [bacterium BMS3Abin02]|nr:DNA-3-methyladenine glycosylase 1 [bacterium BMS3Abin02]GBE21532.1 DNA-3-methyladenine glycosylase 1 [bacterium BMS3Bbin01]HDH25782.1 DNA-3-methyladenine glycosylase I [Actinomycetota bacterium]HDK45948.1 DNA-3-methyladenine glycosylase I [Actinomycetota bacterium]HDL49895.1 DNA-3-methyladenine glycosylase I [Actinomycetota bacterium]